MYFFVPLTVQTFHSGIMFESSVETVARYKRGEKYFSATDQKYFSTKYYLYFFLVKDCSNATTKCEAVFLNHNDVKFVQVSNLGADIELRNH